MSAIPPTLPARAQRGDARHLVAVPNDEYFGRQSTSSARLPDPQPLIENLAGSVIEVLAGARDLEQIARWMSEPVYKHLLRRTIIAARGRDVRKQPAGRPVFSIAASRLTEPADGVVEATVIVLGRARTRAVAIRLEGIDSRWRATALHVL